MTIILSTLLRARVRVRCVFRDAKCFLANFATFPRLETKNCRFCRNFLSRREKQKRADCSVLLFGHSPMYLSTSQRKNLLVLATFATFRTSSSTAFFFALSSASWSSITFTRYSGRSRSSFLLGMGNPPFECLAGSGVARAPWVVTFLRILRR